VTFWAAMTRAPYPAGYSWTMLMASTASRVSFAPVSGAMGRQADLHGATLPDISILKVFYPEVEIVAEIDATMPFVAVRQVLGAPVSSNKLIRNRDDEGNRALWSIRRAILHRHLEFERAPTLVIAQAADVVEPCSGPSGEVGVSTGRPRPTRGVAPRRYTPPSPGCSPPLPPGASAASVARPSAEPREKGQQGQLEKERRRGREEAVGKVPYSVSATARASLPSRAGPLSREAPLSPISMLLSRHTRRREVTAENWFFVPWTGSER
jgi:hypothetical protein